MAQQTINVGAAPNDGTGTPLRTAFQYTNSNFSELYTAVGPSGNNIVVPGNATITGDLTVDTSTLKVDSANNRVIVGHTSGSSAFQVTNAGAAGLEIQPTGFSSAPLILSYNRSGSAYTQLTLDGSTIVHALNGSTAMTLNSTGLGVGVASPAQRLHVKLDQNAYTYSRIDNQNASSGAYAALMLSASGNSWGIGVGSAAANSNALDFFLDAGGANSLKMRLDSSGNVGIGVTPSVQLASYKSFQFGIGGNLIGRSDNSGIELSSNSYRNSGGNYIYLNTATAASYRQYSGGHEWHNAPSGTAGTAITFTQAMTLDASGNLLVGTTSLVSGEKLSVNAGSGTGVIVKNTGGATYSPLYAWNATTTGDGYFSVFFTETAATFRGSISYNRAGGLVAYNVTSDYRAKDIIGPVSNSGSLIDSLKVYIGKMKGATIERPMLIAHEAQEVAPYAVTGLKDEVDADGKDKYQQMDVSSFVPLLIAEIQSLRARVQTLEAR